ncbi:ATP-grasp domain-containing protein [Duganella radicis]|uniref:ATP-grasp domain-containing protein n=1 Tax=Duganella radicis TaxID=551988 RepID=UPI001BAB404B|nr:hypothetical protein [Duganella radicis]
MAESPANQLLLEQLADYVSDWPRPVINRPERIRQLSRDNVCAALQGVPGLALPLSVRVDRGALNAVAAGTRALGSLLGDDGFPMIVRPLGSHSGADLEKIAAPAALAAYLDAVEGVHFYISRFVDYRNVDGLFRQYRIVLIDGKPFICHFAISRHWMIHYPTAGMTESAAKRAEEAACMAAFDDGFAVRHQAALAAIHQRMGLPYLGIDCAEMPNGDLLIFEVDNAMIVHGMDPADLFPYKVPAMQRVFNAFRALLARASAARA